MGLELELELILNRRVGDTEIWYRLHRESGAVELNLLPAGRRPEETAGELTPLASVKFAGDSAGCGFGGGRTMRCSATMNGFRFSGQECGDRSIRTELRHDNGCRLICSELVNSDGVYTIDFADFERKLADERVKVFLLCSPHNPVGRVWRREELERMLSLCRQYGVRVIADEIHHDFTYGEPSHIPTATVGDHDDMLVTLTAPSKTFNLAGLKTSVIIIPDPELRKSWDAYTGKLHTDSGNSFGVTAAEAAYTGGRPWLDQVLRTVRGNYEILRTELLPRKPDLRLSPLEGTYLAWLDLGAYVRPDQMVDVVEGKCGLAVDYGSWFGGNAATHIRVNLATRPENIRQAADALAEHL